MRTWNDSAGRPLDEEDRGLTYDVTTLVGRRTALGLFGGVSVMTMLAACGMTSESPTAPGGSASGLVEVPEETEGPYPADGSNGVDVLSESGIVRRDIRSSFGSSTRTAEGVPLELELTVLDVATGEPLAGAAVYLWQCDATGGYSLYSSGLEDENYLRGVQQIDADGVVRFTTIFPGCYPGRWPHLHFEVYRDLDSAIDAGPMVKTSQIALTEEASRAVYAEGGYPSSTENLGRLTLRSDMVFGEDEAVHQLATMSGSPSAGYTATLTIGV